MRKSVKKVLSILIVVFGEIIIGYFLIVLTYLIPTSAIWNNVKASATILQKEGLYPDLYLEGLYLDNWTDADCISVTLNTSSSNPFYNALNAFQMRTNSTEDNASWGTIKLVETVKGNATIVGDHSHLWHGFRIWLRILLTKYDITDIRFLTVIINSALFVLVCLMIFRWSTQKSYCVPFVIAFLYFNFILESLSLLFFNDIGVMLIGCLLVLWYSHRDKKKYLEEVFAGIGTLLAFTSMLILPLITLGYPLIIWLMMCGSEISFVDKMKGVVKYSLSWLCGYAITIFSKILLSVLIIHSSSGIARVFKYSGMSEAMSIKDRLYTVGEHLRNALILSEMRRDILFLLLLIIFIIFILKRHQHFRKGDIIPYMFIAVFPLGWIFILAGHAHHGWTTFNFSVTIYAVLQMLWTKLFPKIEIKV